MPKKQSFQISCFSRLLYGWGIGAALICILFGGSYLRSWEATPRHFNTMLDEIFTDGRIIDAPIANHTSSMLLYAQELKDGLGIFLEDLTSLQRRQIQTMATTEIQSKKVFKIFGWSPDDNYLAFAEVAESTNKDKEADREIIVCDGTTGARESLLKITSTPEAGAWLSTNTLVLLTYSHQLILLNLNKDENLGRMGRKGFVRWLRLNNSGSYGLVSTSDHSVGYIDQGNIWNWDIPTGRADQLTHLSGATIEWLDYSWETGKYLFCMNKGTDVTNRYVYEFTPNRNSAPTQLTETYSLKGQWLNGDEFACVRTEGDKSYLTIESAEKTVFTNLFIGEGSVRSYSVSPGRDKIYAVASFRYKALSIWEYDTVDKSSRDVLVRKEAATSASQTVLPVPSSTINSDRETVEYYLVPPAKLVSSKKYPAVLDLYPVNRYDQNVQILANAGIFYYAANRYGLNDWKLVAKPEDILAVYNNLIKNPNVDTNRIYICGRSYSTMAVTTMVNEHPDFWHGVILFSPIDLPTIPKKAAKYPNFFIAIGDEDDPNYQTKANRLWEDACRQLVPARIHYEHTGHNFKTADYKTSYAKLVNFIRTDY